MFMRGRPTLAFGFAIWTATLFGFLEGAILWLTRSAPVLNAAHKVSGHILWVAPLVDVIVVGSLVVLVAVAAVQLRIPQGRYRVAIAHALPLVAGSFLVIAAPSVIHPVAATLLALGLGVAVWSLVNGRMDHVRTWFSRLWYVPPLLIGACMAVVTLAETWQEKRSANALGVPPAGAQNVLILVLDTVRYDLFERPLDATLTPMIHRFASRGVQYRNAWSTTSWSLPSQASILTGSYPYEHGADWPTLKLRDDCVTLAEALSSRGYATGAFSGNAAWITPEYVGAGFLRFNVYNLEDLVRRTVAGRILDRVLNCVRLHYAGRGTRAPKVNAQFLRFVDDYPDRPFFGYLCYMDVNQAFHNALYNSFFFRQAPIEDAIEAYEEEMAKLDADIGGLLGELEQRGLLKDTIVVITSDHGESFGVGYHNDHAPCGHGTSLYPEQTRIPLMLVAERCIDAGIVSKEVVSLKMIPSTVMRLLGLPEPGFEGPMLPVSPRADTNGGSVALSLLYGNRHIESVVSSTWQYIRDQSAEQAREELLVVDENRALAVGLNRKEFQVRLDGLRRELARLLGDGE
jgi:hypothetical protein